MMPTRLRWYAPWWSYGPARFREARERRLWGLRVWIGWVMFACAVAAVGVLVLSLTHAAVLAHVSWLRVALLPVAVLLIPLCVAAELLPPSVVRIEPGIIRVDGIRISDNLVAARIEPDADGRGKILRVEYRTASGRERSLRVGVKASIDPRVVKAVFERGTTRVLAIHGVSSPH